uniref:ribonuclease P protein component n=1 Tax=Yoonia sp. TaxID=2212373 RepID=UPI0040478590
MKPPMAPLEGDTAVSLGEPSAVCVCPPLTMLTKRADFLRAANGRRQGTPGIHLQARRRAEGEAPGIRVGYTCSKKVGNAVARNRAKRRLREVARLVLPAEGRAGWDYVLVGRNTVTATLPFPDLIRDMRRALTKVHS